MYCSQCGKKVMDNMLFCPFCGSPIVIPDQEEEPADTDAISEMEADREPAVDIGDEEGFSASEWELAAEKSSEFVPLDIEAAEDEKVDAPEKDLPQEVSELLSQQLQQEPVRLQGLKPDLRPVSQFGAPKISSPRKNADTFIPQRRFDPDDMFMDSVDEEENYEDYDDDDYDDYDYEDDDELEEGAFWVQHIRGLVAFILLMSVAAVLIGWSFSNSGQQALARADLAWRPSAYAEIAYDAYQKGNYSQAGSYYSKAVSRDSDNYNYASSASIAYYMAQDMQSAENLARLAIQIDPSKIDAYDLLLRLYPDSASRSEELQSIFQKGYELTGDSRLIAAQ